MKDDKLEVRLGAILTLESVCTDFIDLSAPVIELLTTYIREDKVDYGETEPPVDIVAITRIIARVSSNASEKNS